MAGRAPGDVHVALLRGVNVGGRNRLRMADLAATFEGTGCREVRGREVYLRCPGGLARSRLTTGWFDARLGTTSTVRNWRTVLALAAMAAGG